MNVYVIMQNDTPRLVVHCENSEDILAVERYCSERDDAPKEYWWSRKFELKAPEDLSVDSAASA